MSRVAVRGGGSDIADTLVLCYHAVSPDWEADLSVRPERLAEQLEAAVAKGYRGVTFAEAVRGGPGKRMAVTFDDAFDSVVDLARPVLDRLDLPGTVFVPTDYAGTDRPIDWDGVDQWVGGPHHHELGCLSWDRLRDLAAAGWEIGAHTCSHPRLTTVGDDALARELGESRTRCAEEIGACDTIAYPYGDVDDRVAEAAGRAGFTAGAELGERFLRDRPLRFPRVGVYHGDDPRRFAVKTSRPLRRVRESRLWDAMAAARRVARR